MPRKPRSTRGRPKTKRGRQKPTAANLDGLWSLVVRRRAGMACMIPGCMNPPQGAHILPKGGYPALRHDPDNGIPLCWAHHLGPRGWHKDPLLVSEITSLLEKLRGPGFMERLRIRALTGGRPDREAVRLSLEQELKG